MNNKTDKETKDIAGPICDGCGESGESQYARPDYAEPDDAMIVDIDGNHLCDDCSEEYIIVDDEYYHVDDERIFYDDIDQEHYTIDEGSSCSDCDGLFHSHNLSHVDHTGYVCNGCIENGEYVFASDVQEMLHRDDSYYCDNCDQHNRYEDSCECDNSENLYSYSTNVLRIIDRKAMTGGKWVPLRDVGNALVLGVELETDTRGDSTAGRIADRLVKESDYAEFGICKSDGSVNGAELVTLPADLDSHRNNYNWENWCEVLRPVARGHHGNENGIHVHVNRAGITALDTAKLLTFIHSPASYEFTTAIAQRRWYQNTYCRADQVSFSDVGKSHKSKSGIGKYTPINNTRDTLEFRIFKANLTPERIYKNLEFVESLIVFCKLTSIRNLTVTDYRDFLAMPDNAARYRNLVRFIQQRGI